MSNQLYIGNLDFQTTAEDLTALFLGAGAVRRVQIVIDRDTQRPKGFAFVEMANSAEALRAISLYNGYVLNQRTLQVSAARPRQERTGSGNQSRGGASNPPKFREVRHKARGGRKARRY